MKEKEVYDYIPHVDFEEQEKQFLVTCDMPGVDKDNLTINVDEDKLHIKSEATNTIDKRRYQKTLCIDSRRLDIENIDAVIKLGILTLSIPKNENKYQKTIKVA